MRISDWSSDVCSSDLSLDWKGTDMDDNETLVTLTADIVAAHVSNNSVAISDIPLVIRSVHEALSALGATAVSEVKQEPAVSIRSSVKTGRAARRERGVQYGEIVCVAVSLKKKKKITIKK